MTDLVVTGGTVVRASGSERADVAILGGRIEAIGPGIVSKGVPTLDATDMLVLPGAVDVHTHVRLPDRRHPRRFTDDLAAAAAGGTTTVLSFNNPGTGISQRGARSLLAGLDEFLERTEGKAPIDYGLCSVVTGQQRHALDELPELIGRGVPTFKAFMVYDFAIADAALPRLLRTAKDHGGMLQLHCEDPSIIDPLVADALARGDIGPRHHALTRPPDAETAATRRAIQLAREAEAPLYIVHLSCEGALEAVAEAKARGEPVYAETCPHYLTFTDALYADPDDSQVMKRLISPPLRTQLDVDALWAGLRDGILDIVSSDHVPDRLDTEKRLPAPPFPEISNGAPGIETLLGVTYSVGVAEGRIGIERLVEALSTAPARLFGLQSKGELAPGRDADLVVWDPNARRTLTQAGLHHTSDFTPFEGLEVRGAPVHVLSRGEPPATGRGRFIQRRL
ncbi:MAG TPA: dihydropyrimidinase [Candidatus Limnocylindria bacterium]|nr:dihydropyrimidinase [Candidatus Limnocylindria bacterium]